jgi:hypothetical protein
VALTLDGVSAFLKARRRAAKQAVCLCGDTTVDLCRCAGVEDASRTLDRVEQATAAPGELRGRPQRSRCRCGSEGYCE